MMKQLFHYAQEERGYIDYYDLCLLHKNDKDIARRLIEREMT